MDQAEKDLTEKPVEYLLDRGKRHSSTVSNISLQNEYDKSFSLQCMSVFYKGFMMRLPTSVNVRVKKENLSNSIYMPRELSMRIISVPLKRHCKFPSYPAEYKMHRQLDLQAKLNLHEGTGHC